MTTTIATSRLPTESDRDIIREHATQLVGRLRDGLHAATLDARLAGLPGASIQRLYVKHVLGGVLRWLAARFSTESLTSYSHHVASQDGPQTDPVAEASLRALARTIQAPR